MHIKGVLSAANCQPVLRVVNLRALGLVDVDGELKRLEKQVRPHAWFHTLLCCG
jgi:hypothetical protein